MTEEISSNNKTTTDLYEVLTASLEVQKQTLARLQEVTVIQQQQPQHNNNQELSDQLEKDLLKVLLANLPNTIDITETGMEEEGEILQGQINRKIVAKAEKYCSKFIQKLLKSLDQPNQRIKGVNYFLALLHNAKYQLSDDHLPEQQEEASINTTPASDNHNTPRDISEMSVDAQGIKLTPKSKITALITQLLRETTGTDPEATDVETKYKSVTEISYNIHAHLVQRIADTEKKSTSGTLKDTYWTKISDELKDTYSLCIEEKVFVDEGLNIGRCQDMWLAKLLLKNAASNRTSKRSHNFHLRVVQSHLSECTDGCSAIMADNVEEDEEEQLSEEDGTKEENSSYNSSEDDEFFSTQEKNDTEKSDIEDYATPSPININSRNSPFISLTSCSKRVSNDYLASKSKKRVKVEKSTSHCNQQ